MYRLLLMLCSQVVLICSAPLHLPLLQPLQQHMLQPHEASLQQQMHALQQLQALKGLNTVPAPMQLNLPQPVLLLIPNIQNSAEEDANQITQKEHKEHALKHHKKHENDIENEGDLDSIVINAERDAEESIHSFKHPQRGIIGNLISYIPFLPIEVNVPDSVSWIYNGISWIISGIGQNLPFRPQQGSTQQEATLRNVLSHIQTKKQGAVAPLLVLPLNLPVLPVHV